MFEIRYILRIKIMDEIYITLEFKNFNWFKFFFATKKLR